MPLTMPLSQIITHIQSHPGPKLDLVEQGLFWQKDCATIVKALNENPCITELNLMRNNPMESDFSELSQLTNIKALDLSQCDVTDTALKNLFKEGTPLRDNIVELNIEDNSITDESEDLLTKLPKIKSLCLLDSGMTQDTIERILAKVEPEPYPPSLEEFDHFSIWASLPTSVSPPPSLFAGIPGFEKYATTSKRKVPCH